jgi:hypothetical protein
MCQIFLNTYSHNEPYDLQAQVIFQKKKLMMTKHFQSNTHFFREHYYYKLYPPNQNECQKNILRDFSTKIQISNLIYFKSLLDNRLPKLAKKGTSTVQIKDKNDL